MLVVAVDCVCCRCSCLFVAVVNVCLLIVFGVAGVCAGCCCLLLLFVCSVAGVVCVCCC